MEEQHASFSSRTGNQPGKGRRPSRQHMLPTACANETLGRLPQRPAIEKHHNDRQTVFYLTSYGASASDFVLNHPRKRKATDENSR